jgi:cell division protein FtsA
MKGESVTLLVDDLILGLDIGTTKVCAAIGDVQENGTINVIGFGQAPSGDGVKRGAIVDIDKTTQAIMDAVDEAEKSADVFIDRVFVGISGEHIHSVNSQGIVAIKGSQKEISREDIDRAVENAKTAINIPSHQEIIHILAREFVVDLQKEISNPVGMVGSRLEAQVHIVTGAVTAIQNIHKCCESAKLKVEEVVLQPYASSMSVLSEDEKKLGVVLVDIGGGTTDIIIFQNGHVMHSYCASIGGQYVTNDIAVGLKTSTATAENLKIKYGAAMTDIVDDHVEIEVPVAGGERSKKYSQRFLAEIIEPRMEEIFNDVKEQIIKHVSVDVIPAGVVLTGGSSLLSGAPELAEDILDLPVRRGSPIHISGLKERVSNPMFSTSVGLLRYGHQFYTAHVGGQSGNGFVDKIRFFVRSFFSE